MVRSRPYELDGRHFAAVGSFWFEGDVGREKGREPSLTVTQHYAAGQDGGGERHRRGGDEEREEKQDGEVGEGFPLLLKHMAFLSALKCLSCTFYSKTPYKWFLSRSSRWGVQNRMSSLAFFLPTFPAFYCNNP